MTNGALLAEAEEAWKRLAADDAALAAYRNETVELASFDAPLRVY